MSQETEKPKEKEVFTKRRFLGKTEGFENNIERHFFQRMLRAYLKGKQYFHFGFIDINQEGFVMRKPKLIRVAQEYYN